MNLGEMDLEGAAQAAAGNWTKFRCHSWCRANELDDADKWCVVFTHHRDSGLLDQSNAAAIEAELDTFTKGDDPDVVAESHGHFGVGWINGFSIRVFRDGNITDAFTRYHELARWLNGCSVLDDEDYSRRQYEATLENLKTSAWRFRDDYDLPDDWQRDVYDWFSTHDYSAIEDREDRGGCPSERQLRKALDALGYGQAALCGV